MSSITPKVEMNNFAQKFCAQLFVYRWQRQGEQHELRYKTWITVQGWKFKSPGIYSSSKKAEQEATKVALSVLTGRRRRRGSTSLQARSMADYLGPIYLKIIEMEAKIPNDGSLSPDTSSGGLKHPNSGNASGSENIDPQNREIQIMMELIQRTEM